MKRFLLCFMVLVMSFWGVACGNTEQVVEQEEPEMSSEEKEVIEKAEEIDDMAVAKIKSSMNHPSSFELTDDILVYYTEEAQCVRTSFKAQNSFGAVTEYTFEAMVDLSENMITLWDFVEEGAVSTSMERLKIIEQSTPIKQETLGTIYQVYVDKDNYN